MAQKVYGPGEVDSDGLMNLRAREFLERNGDNVYFRLLLESTQAHDEPSEEEEA